MIDIAIRSTKPPIVRIGLEMSAHVLVDQPLQINPDNPIRSNDHIRADAYVIGDVASRIVDLSIAPVVSHPVARSLERCFDETSGEIVD
jgi:hypothetical protein